ncbi:MAG: tripartite tricarboxylate transporter permease [Planctomycetaceae bacterium]|nr:tripartite tricarboxylate transporter permease [Planctomycetaceae bacterium]
MLSSLHDAFWLLLAPKVMAVILLSAAYGIAVGAIPGLTATMAVALIIPITFHLDPISAIAAIVTLEACAIFAGDIPCALVRIPGTPSSAAYTDDAYTLSRRGLLRRTLGVSLVFSVAGGLFGTAVLILGARQLARVAFAFTTYEYFWLYVFGLSCAAIVSHGSRVKGALSLVIGLLLSTIGLSEVHSTPRFTLGNDDLITGVSFIPAMIGLFGFSEVLRNVLSMARGDTDPAVNSAKDIPIGGSPSPLRATIGDRDPTTDTRFGGVFARLWSRKLAFLRSSGIGTIIGMIPGAGADIAAWISYAVSKRLSKTPEEYGKGSLEGMADATAANNASLAGAWIPALVFGIPGDSVTAIVLGVLMMKNITPGPQIFDNPKQATLVSAIYLTFIVANLILIPLGALAIHAGTLLIRTPRRLLVPLILLFCIVGSFAINGSYFDVGVMLLTGLLGFALERWNVPLGPIVLGIVLGGEVEKSFIQNLTKSDSLVAFFERPVAAGLGAACLALWLLPPLLALRRLRRHAGTP